jgi:hypothetical protein
MNIISSIKNKINTAIKETAGNIYQELEDQSQISINDINEILGIDQLNINPEYKEIEFFKSNDNEQPTIYSLLSENLSITGKWYLKFLLSIHITDITELKKRQLLIKYFSTNKQINIELNNYITFIKNIEKDIYWFIKPHNPELTELLKSVYFTKIANFIDLKKVNDTEQFMNYYYTFLMIISPVWGIFSPVIFFIMPYFFTVYFLKLPMKFSSYVATLKATLFGDNIFNTIKGVLSMFIIGQIAGSEETKSFAKRLQLLFITLIYKLVSSPYVKYIYLGFVVIGYIWSLFTSYSVSRNYYKFIKFLHNRVLHLHILINNTNTITDIINKNNLINKLPNDLLNTYNKVNEILKTPVIQEIISNENKDYFSKSYNILSNKGIVLSLYHKISNYINPEDILLLVKFNSMLETYINFTQNYIFTHFNPVKYIIDTNKPQLTVLSMYNPVCGGYEKCIPNSLNLFDELPEESASNKNTIVKTDKEVETIDKEVETIDEEVETIDEEVETIDEEVETIDEEVEKIDKHLSEGFKNMILTGPNGSGKSTFLKTIMSSVILAQSIGYAPVKLMELTPFTYLSTYLNIPDCTGKESLFQAEMSRCHNHLQKLKKLDEKENAFSFNIMDEIFVSTNYYEGISGAWAVMRNVVKYNNSINIITTHFDKCIEKPISGYIYKHFTLSDDLTNDYKLIDGINKKHCALGLLEKYGFDKELIEEAKNKYSEIKI